MSDDVPNAKAAARNKHRQNNSQKDKSKFKAKQASNKAAAASADNKAKKQPLSVDLKTTVLNISAPELEEFSRREVSSNWKKYEESGDTEEHEQNSAYDFGELLQMPKSVGGHFQFAAEKKWETTVDEEKKYSKFFHLDTNILNCGLLTIPFYERQGYEKSLFSSGDIIRMNIEADTHKSVFDQLTKCVRPKEESVKRESSKIASSKVPSSDRPTIEASVKQLTISPAIPPEKAEIQQWLDDILDD